MAVLRELLPSPLPSFDIGRVTGVSRAVERRLQKRCHVDLWARDAVSALNELSGVEMPPVASRASEQQQCCVQDLMEAVRSVGAPPEGMHGAGAFRELCAIKAGSYDPVELGPCQPFVEGSVSLPPAVARHVEAQRFLSGSTREQ